MYFLFKFGLLNLISVSYFVINFLSTSVNFTLISIHAGLFILFILHLLIFSALEPYLSIVKVYLYILFLLPVCFCNADLLELVFSIA